MGGPIPGALAAGILGARALAHRANAVPQGDHGPGEPEQALGGFGNAYYQHAVEIEVYVEEGNAAVRDTAFDAFLQQIGVALEADPTLGGLAFGLTYGRPEPTIEAIAGAPAIKSATLTATVDYETDAPLA
jgi:hypothetical protein